MQLEFNFVSATPAAERAEVPVSPEEAPSPIQSEAARLTPDQLHEELERRTHKRIALVITNNRSRMISFRPDERPVLRLRVHRMFLSAPPEVIKALAHWIAHPRSKKASAAIDAYIRENHHHVPRRQRRAVELRTQGRHFDLAALFEDINRGCFQGTVNARITWGRHPTRTRRRSIRFGSYNSDENLIRIHPLLDQRFVPKYFVRSVVHHEMLHAHLGVSEPPTKGGRRQIHTPAFKRLERAFPDYARAIRWQEDERNLNRLLRRRTPA